MIQGLRTARAARADIIRHRRTEIGCGSQRLQKCDQVRFFLIGEADSEALIVEIHHVIEGGGGAIVEIGRPRGESTQDGSFHFPTSTQLPLISALPRSVT